jgi:hypothetical protein
MSDLRAPFPYFGGKSQAAGLVWPRFGAVRNYVEPFFGSGAMLLGRPVLPGRVGTETVNDKDALLANVWRAIKADPEAVARWADYPVIEADLEARHYWLVCQRGRIRELMADPHAYDAKAAGWWIWGACAWIGSGWCDGGGPWSVERGRWAKGGEGINRKLPHLGDRGQGILTWLDAISERIRDVRVACGDWRRVLGDSVTVRYGATAVFLDPPYVVRHDLYGEGCGIFDDVWSWAMSNGDDPRLRIALCGYADGRAPMPGWTVTEWRAPGGYANQSGGENVNAGRERIWFSPHCMPEEPQQRGLDFG